MVIQLKFRIRSTSFLSFRNSGIAGVQTIARIHLDGLRLGIETDTQELTHIFLYINLEKKYLIYYIR